MIHRQAERVKALQAQTDAAYDRWAPIYDLIFDLPFSGGRRAAAEAAGAATPARGELLVVGVGTGLELEMLPGHARVTGVDLSAPMLQVARKRVARDQLSHVKALIRMDACQMTFDAASFDTVLAPYVLTVVPKPEAMLEDAWRVLKPGGEMVVVSHFSAERGLRGRFRELARRLFGLARLAPAVSLLDPVELGQRPR